MSDAQLSEFKASSDSSAPIGDVESSYAFQRMTSNLVTGKQKRNVELQKEYGMTVTAPTPLAPSAAQPAPVNARPLSQGTRLKVLGKKDGQVQVRDDEGNEGWFPAAGLIQAK